MAKKQKIKIEEIDNTPAVDTETVVPEEKQPEKVEFIDDGARTFPVEKDNVRAEKESIERVVRKINIKYNSPAMKTITKTVVYDCKTKQVVSAQYETRKD